MQAQHQLTLEWTGEKYRLRGGFTGQQKLGHADLKTTQGYIGMLDADARKPRRVYTPPHWTEMNK